MMLTFLIAAGCGSGKQPHAAGSDPDTEIRTPPLPVKPVARKGLKARAAMTRFDNRSSLDATLLDAVFYSRMVPLVQEEAGRTQVVLPGDPAYPAGLDGFTRDVYGRLDAFGLATVARQENLNAVVTGIVLDAAVVNELTGFLLWKETEGRLRILILVEVFGSETGTKLLSRTFEYETEVPGMTPESTEEALRESDMPIVREALDELAEEIGESVGELLDELDWQGYVTNVVGDRLTLSSDAASGLAPGNILQLYDSRVLEGLDGRQFFLRSDPVGSMQVTDVFADRTEGVVLQGDGIGIYSFAVP